MSCGECAALKTHVFGAPDHLVQALRLAAEEMDRGVLERDGTGRVDEERDGPAELVALRSATESGEMPRALRYAFRCTQCGDRFTLEANPADGSGEWRREVP